MDIRFIAVVVTYTIGIVFAVSAIGFETQTKALVSMALILMACAGMYISFKVLNRKKSKKRKKK